MRRFMRLFDVLLDNFTTCLFFLMLVFVLLQILARYALRVSIPWTEEAARILLIFITFLGACTALRQEKHITISFLYDRFPIKVQRVLSLAFIVGIAAFLYVLVRGSVDLIELSWDAPSGSIAWLQMGKVYLILPISCLIMAFYLIRLFKCILDMLFKNGETSS